jgi:flagellum-specific peptidoglycan hydrolase FlgJ
MKYLLVFGDWMISNSKVFILLIMAFCMIHVTKAFTEYAFTPQTASAQTIVVNDSSILNDLDRTASERPSDLAWQDGLGENTGSPAELHHKHHATHVEAIAPKRVIDYSHLTSKEDKKIMKVINHWFPVALKLQEKQGIPAVFKIAQLIEEGYKNGEPSDLYIKTNNGFGIKCFSNTCKKGHCVNATDDTHKDYFRKYDSLWLGFHAHGVFLNGKRYKPCQECGDDWECFSECVSEAGYATNKMYHRNIKRIVKRFKLDQRYSAHIEQYMH